MAPFAGVAVLAWIAVIVGSRMDWWQYAGSVALLGVAGSLMAVRIARPGNEWFGVIPNSLVFLAAVALLRNSAGGISSGASALALIPVFHTALYSRSRRDLCLVLAAVGVFYLAPILILGAPRYPDAQYRAALFSVLVGSIVGLATQRLVDHVRHQAAESRSRERMLQQVSEVVRGLLASSQARRDVCDAARDIGQAVAAVIYEPVPATGALRATAMAGTDTPIAADVPASRRNALREAFQSGSAVLVTDDVEAHVGSHELWETAGRPQTVLYQPLLHGGDPLGVLVVGWSDSVRDDGPRTTVVALLAHEAAAAIERADAVDQLTDMTQTDPLTGLPNRRAWDAHVKQAVAEQRVFVIATLDFDRFKEFNDTHGHLAGDRLLKETAAAWRGQLRGGDLLARLGGEEFGLLLIETDHATAVRIVERLRAHVSHARTCSAGMAIRRPAEPPESVFARADRALYAAKAAGRDQACVSA